MNQNLQEVYNRVLNGIKKLIKNKIRMVSAILTSAPLILKESIISAITFCVCLFEEGDKFVSKIVITAGADL